MVQITEKYNISRNKIYTAIKGKGRARGSQYRQKKRLIKRNQQHRLHIPNLLTNKIPSFILHHTTGIWFIYKYNLTQELFAYFW